MRGRCLRLASGLAACLVALGAARAQSLNLPSAPSTGSCEEYSEVTCTSTNAGVNADILQNASDTRDQLGALLQLGRQWRFPVHIHVVMPDDPLADRIHEERSGVTASGNTMTIEASLPFSDPDLKAFIRRQYVTAMLWEKFFAQTKSFDAHTNLAVVPVWLVEGLTEWVSDDTEKVHEGIVRRAATIHRAPTLNEITGWEEISQDRLLGLYQRAFCYYLVNSLIHTQGNRASFQGWLATYAGGDLSQAKALFPTEATWQQQLLQAPERSHEIIYSWDESATALSAAETIAIPGAEPKDTRIGTLDGVAEFARSDKLVVALQKKTFELTALELRAHPSWRPIVALYRFALTAVINGHPAQAQAYIQQAQHQRVVEAEYHRKLTDYVNWFEVTKDYAGRRSHFDVYFSTAQAMDEAQADPDRPNPIRADLIQVESQL